jgi:hypothetical protein
MKNKMGESWAVSCADINLNTLGTYTTSLFYSGAYYYILDKNGGYIYHSLIGNTNLNLTIIEAEFAKAGP